jgi:thiol-disulfide isomerase/thioredoxin
MAVTREEFQSGVPYEQWKAGWTRNQDRFAAQESSYKPDPADVEALKKLPKPVNVLAIVEDWCGDVVAGVPIIERLAKESGKLNIRYAQRDSTPFIDRYLNKGQFKSIPVFVFLDENFNELGVYYERPEAATKLRADKRAEVFKNNPKFGDPSAPPDQLPEDVRNELNAALQKMRDETQPDYNKAASRWIRELAGAK